jgi:hypothetical protein
VVAARARCANLLLLTSVEYCGIDGTSLVRHFAKRTHPQPCAEAPDVAEMIERTRDPP